MINTLLVGIALAADGYDVEVPEFPTLGSMRMAGMGGAFTGIGEGASGQVVNPAAFAIRRINSRGKLLNVDLALDTTVLPPLPFLPGSKTRPPDRPALFGQAGANLKIGDHGFGVHAIVGAWTFPWASDDDGQEGKGTLVTVQGSAGYAVALLDQQLIIGATLQALHADLRRGRTEATERVVVNGTGSGASLGMVWAATESPWRFGLTARSAIFARRLDDERPSGGPEVVGVRLPARASAGVSYKLGGLPYNGTADLPRGRIRDQYLILAADFGWIGGSNGAVDLAAVIQDVPTPLPARGGVEVRLGAETELIPGWLRLRGGLYTEPLRHPSRPGYAHGTAGADVFLFEWPKGLPWRVSGKLDVTRGGFTGGAGVGWW